jgi:hypothetical protein
LKKDVEDQSHKLVCMSWRYKKVSLSEERLDNFPGAAAFSGEYANYVCARA